MNKERILLVGSLFIIFVLGAQLLLKPKEVEKIVYKEQKCTETTKLEVNKGQNYVLLGDSITAWYPIEEYFDKEIPLVKSGVAGYQTKNILENIEEMVVDYNPTKVFILIGTNDLEKVEKEVILENIEEIINIIKKERPRTEIYFESILPINNTDTTKVVLSTVGKRDNNYINTINKEIKDICKKEKVHYLDINKEFIDENNQLKVSYTKDGLHLNEYGYYKLSQILIKNM